MKTKFGQRLGMLRQERHLSQREAAAQLGISQALLSHYENSTREPKFDFILHVCDFFEVTADYLLGRTSERKPGAQILSEKVRDLAASLQVLKKEEVELIDKLTQLVDDE